MKKNCTVIGLMAAVWIVLLGLQAQAAEGIRKVPVHFKKGASQATLQGHIKGRQTIDYVLRARAGQTMRVDLKTSSMSAYFNVLPPWSEEAIFIGPTGGAHFEGTLPEDGDYRVRVYLFRAAARRNESAKYNLTVKVTGGEAGAKDEKAHHESQHHTPAHPAAATLQTYDDPHTAIRTQYPGTMKVEATGSSEGSGFIFTFKPHGKAMDKAEVHIFLPKGAATATAQEPFVTGKNGLLANNGWKKEGETGAGGDFPYSWVKKVMSFSDPKHEGMIGNILLGETNGQAMQVVLYYPGSHGQDFLADAGVILKNLHFKSDKLPLGKAQ
jgi:hypothetical protein